MNLVIVESPAKAKTISKFLGKGFKVESSFGHIRDLPKSKMGVDPEKDFAPDYVIPKDKSKHVTALKKLASKADLVYLATDEDREGEAISWHLAEALKIAPDRYKRISFHEITKEAIEHAVDNPRALDFHRVDAQQARRILDRLVGYELSPLLWKKVARGLSAGRVQSVAVRLIVEREREIEAYKPQEYWTIEAILLANPREPTPAFGHPGFAGASHIGEPVSPVRTQAVVSSLRLDPSAGGESPLERGRPKDGGVFTAKLQAINGKPVEKFDITNETQAKDILAKLEGKQWSIAGVASKKTSRKPPPPFTTSTLQQDANRKLGFSAKQTMMFAQQLYEGIGLGSEGSVGLITYMRTDSLNLAEKFLNEAKGHLSSFGPNYTAAAPRRYTTKTKLAQEAHEAIRPTDISRTPEHVKPFLSPEQWKLYDLIWRRALSSQMPDAVMNQVIVDVGVSSLPLKVRGTKGVMNAGVTPPAPLTLRGGNDATSPIYNFRATGSTIAFDGFLKLYPDGATETFLPTVKEGEHVTPKEVKPLQHFTEPKPRYSEASLIKALEELGIGRPSTYAPTISTVVERGYVIKEERRLKPTDMAFVVNDLLVEHFPSIVDYQFTANMENELDDIAEGKRAWVPVIKEFYDPFKKTLSEKEQSLSKKAITTEETNEVCDKCGKPLVIRLGRFGKFLACSGYPECKNTKPLPGATNGRSAEENERTAKLVEELKGKYKDETCEKCGSPMAVKVGRFGPFLSCSAYPECKTIKNIEQSTGVKCPQCGKGDIIVKRSKRGKPFYACNQYPDCKNAYWSRPTGEVCPECKSLLVYAAKDTIKCSSKTCKYKK